MPILVDSSTRLICQGITGSQGSFHTEQCIEYGTTVVGGVTPGKGGTESPHGLPVFNTVKDAMKEVKPNATMIFVPPKFAANAILEAEEAGIELIVCITEGIPILDMLRVKKVMDKSKSRLIGPNCPGIITPGQCKIGIMPGFVFKKGKVGIVSKSGTLTYEAADQVVKAGLGITTAIGIGGDPIIGTTTKEAVELLMNDPATEGIIMIGEIGGSMEADAANWIKDNMKKPVVGFIAGHAGAIIGGADDTAEAKMKIMTACGIHVCASPADIGKTMAAVLKK